MDSSTTAFKVRAQLAEFLGIFSTRFSKPIQRFIGQMLFGIQAAQDVKLSQIGRELQEPIRISKVENRLSRNLAHEGMADMLHACVLDYAAHSIHQDTLIIIDPTDIQKQYARKMDYLAKVWDGSKGKLGENLGYTGCMAVACESGARRMMPLALRLWSCADFQSENAEVAAVVDSIAKRTNGRGIYVYDRGGDRINFFEHLLDANLRFIVRLVGNRNLIWRKKTLLADKLANNCRMLHASKVTFQSHGREIIVPIQIGVTRRRERLRREADDATDEPEGNEQFPESVAGRRGLRHALARGGDNPLYQAVVSTRRFARADLRATQEHGGVGTVRRPFCGLLAGTGRKAQYPRLACCEAVSAHP